MDKLYIVTREDLSPGSQAVQSCHAARQYAHDHPDMERAWFDRSNHLACLSTKDEASLMRLIRKARDKGVTFSIFREPDLGNSITAVAFEPGDKGRRICSGLRLMLSRQSMDNERNLSHGSPESCVLIGTKSTEEILGRVQEE